MLVLSMGLGGGSLLAFAVFLFAGPPRVLEFELSMGGSLATNTCLSLLFFVQHSGMVRQCFKKWLARVVPEYYVAAIYSLASGAVLLLVVLVWQESPHVIASADGAVWWGVRMLFVLAVAGLIWAVLSLDEFDPFGRKAILHRLRPDKASTSILAVRGPYRWVRHPFYFCVLLMIWSYPYLTVDRALFNVLWTIWIVIGTLLEERDLLAEFGDRYRAYQNNVPMLIPYRHASVQ